MRRIASPTLTFQMAEHGEMKMGKLNGKIALITGGSEGMGFDTAKEFLKEGAFVFITGRRKTQLDKAVQALGDHAAGIQADAGKLGDLDEMYAEISKQKGKLDVVFANAGVYEQMPNDQVTEEFYDTCTDINAKGVFFTIQKALPLMDKTGSIILNGSFIGSSGFPGMSVYGATKAAVRSFARTFTAELKGTGPRVNVLSPGPIHTAGNAASLANNKQVRDYVTAMVPLGRIGEGSDIARVAVFLASEDSSFVAGVEMFVDGGLNAV
jgi:NAD(P)-dependent dehydrogenase (short-subunit alcohol dehydrogenase family)